MIYSAIETKFFQNRNRDFFSETKFFETETETLKNLAKVSRPRPKPRLLNIFWNEIWEIWDSTIVGTSFWMKNIIMNKADSETELKWAGRSK